MTMPDSQPDPNRREGALPDENPGVDPVTPVSPGAVPDPGHPDVSPPGVPGPEHADPVPDVAPVPGVEPSPGDVPGHPGIPTP